MDHPTVFGTADILVYNSSGHFILGRKEKDGAKWRLPGGFTDPLKDKCYLDCAVREAGEELTFDFIPHAHDFVYLGDYEVQDERYKDTEHTVFTNLYAVKMDNLDLFAAGDDLKELTIMDFNSICSPWSRQEHFITPHQPLMEVLLKHLTTELHENSTAD